MDKASHLSVVLDLSPTQWHRAHAHALPLPAFLAQLLAFLNAHIACKDENSLAVFGALPGRSVMLYASTMGEAGAGAGASDANTYRPFRVLDERVVRTIQEEVDALGLPEDEAPIGFVGALTKALCYINRITSPAAAPNRAEDPAVLPDPRILVISVSPDQSPSYIPIMNSIFSAQKLKVTIDVCKLAGEDSVFLQQAAHLTGGSYINVERPDGLLQYLMMSFLPPPGIRQLLSVPTQDKIDLRAACFCHKNIVDIGYVCSVCLSIFCRPVPVCTTCKTKFPIKTLQRFNAARQRQVTPSAAAASAPSPSPAPPNTLPRSSSINVGTPRPAGNGAPRNGTPAFVR